MKTLKLIGEYLVAGILLLLFIASLIMMTSTDDYLALSGSIMLCVLLCLCLLTKVIIERFERRKR